jgi:ribosome modulation factor
MIDQPPKPHVTRPSNRPKPKLMTRAEQAALAAQQAAKREGAVAFHHRKARDTCPLEAINLLRTYWLEGWDSASQRRNRLDMSPARAEGFRAFQDVLHLHECRYGRTNEHTEWAEGWEQAKRVKDTENDRRYR